jgi:hypothetical protein
MPVCVNNTVQPQVTVPWVYLLWAALTIVVELLQGKNTHIQDAPLAERAQPPQHQWPVPLLVTA